MPKIKLLAIALFGLFAFVFIAADRVSVNVLGRSAGAPPPVPTGLSASDNDYNSKVGLLWNPVRGATTYRIFRNVINDPNTSTEIGSTPANNYFDTTAVAEQQYFYWVRAENSGGLSGFSTSDQGIRAIGGPPPGPFLPQEPPDVPVGNQITAAKAALGKTLFWDEQMSSTGTVSCGTCHRPAEGGSDPRTVIGDMRSLNPGPDGIPNTPDDIFGSPGVPGNNANGTYSPVPFFGLRPQVTGRKSPSYLNAGYGFAGLFWDGRASETFRDPVTNLIILDANGSLESQAAGPPLSPVEMGHFGQDWPMVAARIASRKPLALASNIPASLTTWIDGRNYPELFEEAFGTPEVTPARIALAIGTHERQLITDRTPFDRWSAGIEKMTPTETLGAELFVTSQCSACHTNAILSDNFFHNIGVRPPAEDRGRGAVTNNPANDGEFKTPTLKNTELQGPYMHNGRFATLEEVVEFYNRGGDHDAPNINRGLIRELGLTEPEKAALVAFMKRPLTDPRVANELPPFDRPQLFTESDRVPTITGTGRAGNGGVVPNAIAIEPPLVGNPSFTVAMAQGLSGADATLVITSVDPGVGSTIPGPGTFAYQQITLDGTGHGSVSIAILDNPALVGQTFFGRWYVVDPSAVNGFSVTRLITFTVFGDQQPRAAFVDFDGDRRTDVSIFRPNGGTGSEWWWRRSSDANTIALQFGAPTDQIVPADFTGDGKTDVAIFRPASGEWFVLRSDDFSFFSFPFGSSGDIPAPGDFDGDGIADAAVYRPSAQTWFIQQSTGGTRFEGFGLAGDIPKVADYDGDGRDDIGVFRPNGTTGAEWWINRSTAGVLGIQFGLATDKPIVGDFTGDGTADIAMWRPSDGFWFVLRSDDLSYFAFPFGTDGDIPAAGDYDGDGQFDAAIFRPSQGIFYIQRSTGGLDVVPFGSAGDIPVPSAYVP